MPLAWNKVSKKNRITTPILEKKSCFKLLDNNLDLYSPKKEYYLKSLEYCEVLPPSNKDKIIFHLFWRVPREFGRKHRAVLISIIVNHLENLDILEINLWSNVDLSTSSFVQDIKEFINFKKWDIDVEKKGTILENCKHINSTIIKDDLCYLESDLFRLIILNKYGGFYIDMDVLLLRNISPINHLEFVYQWGSSGFSQGEPSIFANNAIMRFNKNSDISNEYLEILMNNPPSQASKNTTYWGRDLLEKLKKNSILILPGAWFDPEFGLDGSKNKPFKNESFDLYKGSFAWHWHNQWDSEIEVGSKFEVLESINETLLKKYIDKSHQ